MGFPPYPLNGVTSNMYKLLRIVSLVLFFGGLAIFPFVGTITSAFIPFAGMVGYLVAHVLDRS